MYKVFYSDSLIIINSEDITTTSAQQRFEVVNSQGLKDYLEQYFAKKNLFQLISFWL